MSATTIMVLGGLAVTGWVLHTLGQYLVKALEALAVIAGVFTAAWLAIKGSVLGLRWIGRHWRSTIALLVAGAWWWLLGWQSLAITAGVVAAGVGMWWLVAWRLGGLPVFDAWVGRHLRAWWMRWVIYARRMPRWLRACRLTVPDDAHGITVNLAILRRSATAPRVRPRRDQLPRILGVRSGPSWDEVRVRLVPGQTPEDFDEAARALAVARGVQRCQIRELAPNEVSIDFQRRDLLTQVVPAKGLGAAEEMDLRRVWSGRTEYGLDWHQPLIGGHTLYVGSTGAGKNSFTWCPLVSIAPAIRDRVVRVSGIDPKGMELAYGRGVFARYAVTAREALELLDELVEEMTRRKTSHAGRVRAVDISPECPLEMVEIDEIAALTKYTGDRKTREAITERIGLLNTQGRALGITVRGYVQEPNKDIIPIRELFPRRVCLRVPTKSHVAMALGDHAWDRGAWANRIGESEAGVGYLFGEGIREPLRVRSGWVTDELIKQFEAFVAGAHSEQPLAPVLQLPAPALGRPGGVA